MTKTARSWWLVATLILCDRAQRRGVANVDCIVRRQLCESAIETSADILVMGRPAKSGTQHLQAC